MFLCLFMFIFLKEKNNGVKKEMENDRAISKFQNKNKPFCKKTEERHNTSLKYISKDQVWEAMLAVNKQAFETLKAET